MTVDANGRTSPKLAIACGGVVAAHAAVVLLGWWQQWSLFTQPPAGFIPMAPTTAAAFLLLAAVVVIRTRFSSPGGRRAARGAAGLVLLLAAFALAARLASSALDPDAAIRVTTATLGRVPLGVMSPVTAAAVLLLALALMLLTFERPAIRAAAAPLATLPTLAGTVVALGYAYGTPLLYGSSTIPVALPTGLSLLLLGGAALAMAGPYAWPLHHLRGQSTRARLLRAFLPATIVIVVATGFIEARIGTLAGTDRVLFSTWLAIIAAAAIALLVGRIARRIGGELDAALAERRRAEERYRRLFEHDLAGVGSVSLDGRFLACNPAFARILGYDSPEDLLAHDAGAIYLHAEDRPAVLARLREAGRLMSFENRLRRKDGREVWVLANMALVPGESGEQVIESTLVDITERKQLEQHLWQSQKMDALGSLAGGVAHDFNNVLTAILGYADLVLLDLPADSPHRKDLDEISRAAQRAGDLTRQLLTFSRRQPIEPRVLNLNDVVADTDKMLRRLIGQEVQLVTVLAPTLGTIRADSSQVHQVLLNLAVNARDAMPDGGTLTIETHEVDIDGAYAQEHVDAQPGAYALLAVSDTGTGMDAATRARVFEPFFTTKEKGKGTGLGLATVYGIVRQHGGHISLYSEIGRGTTFKIYLPRAQASAEPERRRRPAAARGGTETILLVEDEAPVRDFVASALKRAGYQVLAAADGDEALRLEATTHEQIDLLLSDGMMSGIRVPEMVGAFRKRRPDARVLLMSGYAQEAFIRQGLMVAGGAFLQKPFTAAGLVAKVREVLDAIL